MTTTDPERDDLEHTIARSRILLSVAAIVSVYIDPTEPRLTRWIFLRGGLFAIDPYALVVLGLHLAYAAGMYAAIARALLPRDVLRSVATWADVGFGACVALVTEGATSPAYVFFAFAILAASCRGGLRFTIAITAACVALYLVLILASGDGPTPNAYVMRPTYLAITGYLLAYVSQQRVRAQARAHALESRADRQSIARSLHDGYVQALAGINLRLESCRELLRRGRGDDALAGLGELQEGVRREYDDVRAYVRSLVDLETRAATMAAAADTRFVVQAAFGGSGLVVEHVLQIMLEGIRNARRHAGATLAAVNAEVAAGCVRVTIADDGVGLRGDAQAPWTIASRVAECGGHVRIAESRSGGARLMIDIPGD